MSGNGRSGRPATPAEVLKLRGSYRPDRARRGVSAGGKPRKPTGLDPIAEAFWDQTVAKLVKSRVAKSIDAPILRAMAETWSLYRRSLDIANQDPTDKNARVAMVSYLAAFDKLASRFGLTPSDRLRLPAAAEPGVPSGKARFFKDPIVELMRDRQLVAQRNRHA